MNIKNDVKRPVRNLTLTHRVLGLGLGLGTQVVGLGLEFQVLVNLIANNLHTFASMRLLYNYVLNSFVL